MTVLGKSQPLWWPYLSGKREAQSQHLKSTFKETDRNVGRSQGKFLIWKEIISVVTLENANKCSEGFQKIL